MNCRSTPKHPSPVAPPEIPSPRAGSSRPISTGYRPRTTLPALSPAALSEISGTRASQAPPVPCAFAASPPPGRRKLPSAIPAPPAACGTSRPVRRAAPPPARRCATGYPEIPAPAPARRDASMSARSQTSYFFSDTTSRSTSARVIFFRSPAYVGQLFDLRADRRQFPVEHFAQLFRGLALEFHSQTRAPSPNSWARPVEFFLPASRKAPPTRSAFSPSRFLPGAFSGPARPPPAPERKTARDRRNIRLSCLTSASRDSSPSRSQASTPETKITCCDASMGSVCAWPRIPDKFVLIGRKSLDAPVAGIPSGTYASAIFRRHRFTQVSVATEQQNSRNRLPLRQPRQQFVWRSRPASEILHDVGDQARSEIARHSPHRRPLLVEKFRRIGRQLVRLAKQIIVVLVQHLLGFPLLEPTPSCAGKPAWWSRWWWWRSRSAPAWSSAPAWCRTPPEWRRSCRFPRAARRPRPSFGRHDPVFRARQKFVHHRFGHHLLDAVAVRAVLNRGHGNHFQPGRKSRRLSQPRGSRTRKAEWPRRHKGTETIFAKQLERNASE